MVALAWRRDANAPATTASAAAKRLFGFSILYLFLLFAVLLVDGSFAPCGG